jgi:ABC-type uncharacterized transport system substrate-binding protein
MGMSKRTCCGLLAILIAGWAAPSSAHPHVSADLRSSVIFDDKGRVSALRIEWIFDDFYSAYALETIPSQKGPAQDKALAELAVENLKNLAEADYFVDVRIDGKRVRTQPARDGRNQWVGRRLALSFTLPLATPADPRKSRVQFSSYDPTYYMEIVYLKGDPVGLVNAGGTGCSARIVAPNLNSEAQTLASMLGRDQRDTAGFGKKFSADPEVSFGALFAETTVIECR